MQASFLIDCAAEQKFCSFHIKPTNKRIINKSTDNIQWAIGFIIHNMYEEVNGEKKLRMWHILRDHIILYIKHNILNKYNQNVLYDKHKQRIHPFLIGDLKHHGQGL